MISLKTNKILFLLLSFVLVGFLLTGCELDSIHPISKPVIETFTVDNQAGDAMINTAEQTVYLEVETNTDLTKLEPTIVVTEGATINPPSGTEQDFTNPVTYTITDDKGNSWDWVITITELDSTTLMISDFEDGIDGWHIERDDGNRGSINIVDEGAAGTENALEYVFADKDRQYVTLLRDLTLQETLNIEHDYLIFYIKDVNGKANFQNNSQADIIDENNHHFRTSLSFGGVDWDQGWVRFEVPLSDFSSTQSGGPDYDGSRISKIGFLIGKHMGSAHPEADVHLYIDQVKFVNDID